MPGRPGRPEGRVVVDAGPLPATTGRRVFRGASQPLEPAHRRLDRREPGVRRCDWPGRRPRRGHPAGMRSVAELGGADPTGDGPPAAAQDSAEAREVERG
jgi:hypothetical protein